MLGLANLQTGSINLNAGLNVVVDNDSYVQSNSGGINIDAGLSGSGNVSLQASTNTGAWIKSNSGNISVTAQTGAINVGDGTPGDTQGISSSSGTVTSGRATT